MKVDSIFYFYFREDASIWDFHFSWRWWRL